MSVPYLPSITVAGFAVADARTLPEDKRNGTLAYAADALGLWPITSSESVVLAICEGPEVVGAWVACGIDPELSPGVNECAHFVMVDESRPNHEAERDALLAARPITLGGYTLC